MTTSAYDNKEKKTKGLIFMLVIDNNSVYEIDEDCIRKKKLPKECGVCDKVLQEIQKNEIRTGKKKGAVKKLP